MIATLSEAIRVGARRNPQGFGLLLTTDENVLLGLSTIGATCALGAAMQAVGIDLRAYDTSDDDTDYYSQLAAVYPYMEAQEDIICDVEGCPFVRCPRNLMDHVVHLNDQHRLTREQIADFVEEYEEKLGFVHLVEMEDERGADDKGEVRAGLSYQGEGVSTARV